MLAQFFANVTPSEKLRIGWENYFKEVDKDYHKFLINDSIKNVTLEILNQKDSLTTTEKKEKSKLQKEVYENKAIINDPIILPSSPDLSSIKLISATVTFLTHRGNNADDKDYNTMVFVDLLNSMNQKAATLNCCGNIQFADSNSENGPFSLEIKAGSSISKETLQHGSINIHIEPVGNDKWHFSCILSLVFSDGTKKQLGWTNPLTVS
jgi:hypothetical protein